MRYLLRFLALVGAAASAASVPSFKELVQKHAPEKRRERGSRASTSAQRRHHRQTTADVPAFVHESRKLDTSDWIESDIRGWPECENNYDGSASSSEGCISACDAATSGIRLQSTS